MNTTGIDWASTHDNRAVSLKPFDLKVGDMVLFAEEVTDLGIPSLKHGLRVGKVEGIYPHIFHISYKVRDDITLKRSFRKLDYQLGEVERYDAE